MSPELLSASIAALVSLAVGAGSFVTNRMSVRSERLRQERNLQRRLTEKLLDLRLASYPGVFEITDALRGNLLFKGSGTRERLEPVYEKLLEWNRAKAALVMSETSLQAYFDLRKALEKALRPESPEPDSAQLEEIWKAKIHFRRSLRRDVNLIYNEEDGDASDSA